MTPTQVFSIVSTLAMPMWILMIFLPKWKVTNWLVKYRLIPILLSVVYAFYIGLSMINGGSFDFSSLDSVMALFTDETAVLAGWVHYLAFDLLIGMWMLNKNKTVGIHPVLMAPCLAATFMLGPIGFLLFSFLTIFKKSNA